MSNVKRSYNTSRRIRKGFQAEVKPPKIIAASKEPKQMFRSDEFLAENPLAVRLCYTSFAKITKDQEKNAKPSIL